MSGIGIAQKPKMQPINEAGPKHGLLGDILIQCSSHKVKLSYEYVKKNVENLVLGKCKTLMKYSQQLTALIMKG
jgi:hypothetical protein